MGGRVYKKGKKSKDPAKTEEHPKGYNEKLERGIPMRPREKSILRDFPGSAVVRVPRFHCKRHRFNPWTGIDPSQLDLTKKMMIIIKKESLPRRRESSWLSGDGDVPTLNSYVPLPFI